jgi:hypothetical protein
MNLAQADGEVPHLKKLPESFTVCPDNFNLICLGIFTLLNVGFELYLDYNLVPFFSVLSYIFGLILMTKFLAH